MKLSLITLTAAIILTANGCDTAFPTSAGSEASLRKFVDAEFTKWMGKQANAVETFESRIKLYGPPIRYDIRSILSESPDPLVFPAEMQRPDDWESWPGYRINTVVEWKSKAGTPIETVVSYTAVWNASEKRWYIGEAR